MSGDKRVVIARSNPVAPDPRVEKAGRALKTAGFAVTIVAWDRSAGLPEAEDTSAGRVVRLRIPAGFGHGIYNLPNLLRWEFGLLAWLLRNRDHYDVVHACDFDTILPALVVRGLFRKVVVYDVFDFYAEMLRATPAWIRRLIRATDLWAMGRVEAVILADESRRRQIAGARPRRIVIICNSPEDLGQAGFETRQQRAPGELRLAFVGLLQVERGILELLQVLESHPQWSLEIAGFGGDEARILPEVARLSNVTFHGRVDYATALAINARSDALIATYDPSIPNHRFASPNKLFEAMMLGKPVVVAEGTSMDRIVLEWACGVVVPYGDVGALDRALSELAAHPETRAQMGAEGRRAYDTRYGWPVMERRLQDLYADLSRKDRQDQTVPAREL